MANFDEDTRKLRRKLAAWENMPLEEIIGKYRRKGGKKAQQKS